MAKKKYKTKDKPLIVAEPAGGYGSAVPDSTGLTFEKVWLMHLETEKKFQEAREQMKETERILKESRLETDKISRETDRILKESRMETERIIKESSLATDKKLNKLEGLFTGQWGKLVEALIEPSALSLFQERGIEVHESSVRRIIKDEKGEALAEYDIILENTTDTVVISVKTTCKVNDINDFITSLPVFKKRHPGVRILAAIAAITYEEQSDKYAYRNGLFVLKAGEKGMVRMLNDKKFKPKVF